MRNKIAPALFKGFLEQKLQILIYGLYSAQSNM